MLVLNKSPETSLYDYSSSGSSEQSIRQYPGEMIRYSESDDVFRTIYNSSTRATTEKSIRMNQADPEGQEEPREEKGVRSSHQHHVISTELH